MPVLRYKLRSRAAPSMARIGRAQLLTTRVVAYAGAYSVVGADADLSIGNDTILTAEAGAFSLSGQSASVLLSRVLAAGAGSYDLSGADADLGITLTLDAGAGSYALAGQDASMLMTRVVVGAAGSFDLTGTDASFLLGKYISAGAGSIDLTGQTASLLLSHVLAAGAGSFDLSGTDAALSRQLPLAADAGSYALTGQDAALYELSFSSVLTGLGLTSGLKLVLDAGDAASYTSGQSWLDRSGGGYDFFRGADGSATSTDPTFNGSAGGLSSSEYFGFDGGDYFTYDSANEAWMNNLHKSGAKFTVMMWVDLAAFGPASLFSTARANTSDVGAIIRTATSDGRVVLQVFNGAGVVKSAATSLSLVMPTSAWALVGVSLDTSDGATGLKIFINGTTESFSGSYSSPSASAATYTTKIGVDGSGAGGILANGSRVAGVMAWEGVALTADQMDAVFEATRDRFGV